MSTVCPTSVLRGSSRRGQKGWRAPGSCLVGIRPLAPTQPLRSALDTREQLPCTGVTPPVSTSAQASAHCQHTTSSSSPGLIVSSLHPALVPFLPLSQLLSSFSSCCSVFSHSLLVLTRSRAARPDSQVKTTGCFSKPVPVQRLSLPGHSGWHHRTERLERKCPSCPAFRSPPALSLPVPPPRTLSQCSHHGNCL